MKESLDPIGELVRRAGPREPVPPDRLHRLRESAHAEWRAHTTARGRRLAVARSLGALAAAAVLLLVVRLATDPESRAPVLQPEVATVEQVLGIVHVLSSEPSATSPPLLKIGDRLADGDLLDTSSGGLAAVRLRRGVLIRVDRGTRLRWSGDGALALDQGAIYVDSSVSTSGPPLEVRTPMGIARDIGTRFEVRVQRNALTVRVRDGLVRVSRPRESVDVNPREEVTLGADGRIERRTIAPSGPEWAWATALARPFTLEGRTLLDFLDWVAAETGWHVRYTRTSDERKARETMLHGSIEGLSPEQAIAAVLPASGVQHTLVDGTLTIQSIAGDPAP